MEKTNIGLVEFAKKALREDWGYVLGTFGQILSPALLKQKQNQGYGVGAYNSRHKAYQTRYIGKRVSDCYGIVKAYLWWQGEGRNPIYTPSQDNNANTAYNIAREKGSISNIPEIPGLVLWMPGHAGVYIGNGEFIECVGSPVGMRKGRIVNGRVVSGSRFRNWFKDVNIKYVKKEEKPVTKKQTVSNWAKKEWKWAELEGYLNGERPQDPITREELAIVLKRLVDKIG